MSYDVLEKEIRQLPESYLEDVSKYIQFLLYQYEQERMSALEESDEVFNAKMQKGLDDVRNGRVTPLDDAFAELKQKRDQEQPLSRKRHQKPLFVVACGREVHDSDRLYVLEEHQHHVYAQVHLRKLVVQL